MKRNEWYTSSTGYEKNHQGLVCEEVTGNTIAVTYDAKHAPLLAAAPELLDSLELMVSYLQESHQDELQSNHHGDGSSGCSYCQAIRAAQRAIAKAKEE